jgi:gamma-glutamylcyclotransferase (GGCT)/AIG2-like uncharacterized protein YtfP
VLLFGGETVFYFAYATNLNQQQMREYCPESQSRFLATLPNYELVFAGWSRQWRGGQATIKPIKGEKVLGAIYEVSEGCLRQLDKYEGSPASYDRLTVTVFSEDGEPIPAVTYIKSGQLNESAPSPAYLAIIQQGYRDWGIV